MNFHRLILSVLLIIFFNLNFLAQDAVDPIPPEVANSASEWALANKDYANTRADLESPINSSNVADLEVAWSVPIPGRSSFGAMASNPIISEGIVYAHDLSTNILAINLEDGSLLWEYRPNLINIGPTGVAVAWDKVFGVLGNNAVVAVDKSTGEEMWTVNLRTQGNTEGINIHIQAYDGLVYVSTVSGGGAGGIIYALDQETGDIVWQWNTIDSEDLWGNPDINGGGGAWYPPAIDVDSGLMYWGISNPAPFPGTAEFPNGSSRPGDNLYTNSIVALNHQTGELDWYNQVLPHDIFDLDFQISPILTTATIDGVEHDIVLGAGKMGKVYAFDRATGDIYWETSVGRHQNDTLTAILEDMTVEVFPGIAGGVETSMAYAEGVVYVPVVNMPAIYTGSFQIGGLPLDTATGELVAIDVNTGIVLWATEFPGANFGAATVVNDLVFTSSFNGMIYAFDRNNGRVVWRYQASGGINGWFAVAGDTIIIPIGVSDAPVLLAFRLPKEG